MINIDTWQAAHLLVKEYGFVEAPKVAAKHAHALKLQGDTEGSTVWVQIARAALSLTMDGPNEGEAVN